MKPEMLNALKDLYGETGNIVWILDEDWEIVWKNCSYDGKKSFPELLGVSENCWNNVKKTISWRGNYFKCKMICSKTGAYRAVMLKETALPVALPFDDESTIHVAQTIKTVADNLKNHSQLPSVQELTDFAKALDGSADLIYRSSYIRKLLTHIREHCEEKKLFEVALEVREIYDEAQEILHDYAETEFISNEEVVFINEDRNFFSAVILAGIVHCCKNPDQRQDLKISVNCTDEKATILIYMTALEEVRKDHRVQGATQFYSNWDGEEALLNTFCLRHEGSWNMIQKEENGKTSIGCKIAFKPDNEDVMVLESPRLYVSQEKHFDVYHAILARICVDHSF